jgi:hypothetical protein
MFSWCFIENRLASLTEHPMAQSANLGPAVHIPPPPRRPRVFYGWFVVLAAFTVTFLGFGSAYTLSVFMGALQRDFAASRGSVSVVFSLAGFLYFFLGLVSGPLADRWGTVWRDARL